jgi:hypothetical protein
VDVFKSLRTNGVTGSILFGLCVARYTNGHGDGMTPPLLAAVAITPLWHVDAAEGGHPIRNIASYDVAGVLQGLLRPLG